jgi:iron complex transport system ATP-binding protein
MILSVQGVSFSYNSAPVLDGVSFELGRGQILGVLGVNGAGKSTLLKCVNRILKPAKGSILLNGLDVLSLSGRRIARRIGYVPQKYSEDTLTVFDTVLLGRKPHIKLAAAPRDYEIVERILHTMMLDRFALRKVSELSGGESQKVIIARALAQEPDILLLDEPTSNLDLKNQVDVMGLIRHVVRDHEVSVIVTMHDLNLALRYADSLLMLRDNTVFACIPAQEVTPKIIREVYGINVILSDVNGYPVVVPLEDHKQHDHAVIHKLPTALAS